MEFDSVISDVYGQSEGQTFGFFSQTSPPGTTGFGHPVESINICSNRGGRFRPVNLALQMSEVVRFENHRDKGGSNEFLSICGFCS
jgi:hypothetical protein